MVQFIIICLTAVVGYLFFATRRQDRIDGALASSGRSQTPVVLLLISQGAMLTGVWIGLPLLFWAGTGLAVSACYVYGRDGHRRGLRPWQG